MICCDGDESASVGAYSAIEPFAPSSAFFRLLSFVAVSCKCLWSRAYLNARLGQVDLDGHLLPHEDVRVAGLGEERLEHVELRPREGGPLAALFARGLVRSARRYRS